MNNGILIVLLDQELDRIIDVIDSLENSLIHSVFCEYVGVQGNLLNPYRPSYPVLSPLYRYRERLEESLDLLKRYSEPSQK